MNVTFIPIIIGALGTVSKKIINRLEDMEVRGRVEAFTSITLLRSARIQRRIPET